MTVAWLPRVWGGNAWVNGVDHESRFDQRRRNSVTQMKALNFLVAGWKIVSQICSFHDLADDLCLTTY